MLRIRLICVLNVTPVIGKFVLDLGLSRCALCARNTNTGVGGKEVEQVGGNRKIRRAGS